MQGSGSARLTCDPDEPAAVSLRRLRVALGTLLAIEARAPSAQVGHQGIEAAYAAAREVEWRMHPRRAGSDLQRLNGSSPGVPVPIDRSTAQVLRFAQRLHRLTEGVFDPCLPELPGRLTDLRLLRSESSDAGGGWVALCSQRLSLDLGGIAKGYAVDRAVAALLRAGCSAGLVNAGGDLRLFGAPGKSILLRTAAGEYRPLWLENGALAASDRDAAQRPPEHRGYYVHRGRIDAGRRVAAVLAPDAMRADALTKCVMLCPPRQAERALRACGARCVG
jgi:FAD:protein FMN transferase